MFLAVVHAGDRFEVEWVMGSRMGLARAAAQGTLYPPLFDGRFHGGTRFMPIPFVLHGWMARITSEYVVSGKLLAYVSFAFLLIVMYRVLRSLTCSRGASLALASTALLTHVGLQQGMSFYADALPAALQLAGVALVAKSSRRRAVIGAAALCVLALFCKSSAIWAPFAIVVWLWKRDRPAVRDFLAVFVTGSLVFFGIFQLASRGRFMINVVGLAAAGEHGASNLLRLLWWPLVMLSGEVGALALIALALVGTTLAVKNRELTIYHVSLACASLVLLVVLTDTGANANHLIDVLVLLAIAAGDLWPRRLRGRGQVSKGGSAVALVLCLGMAAAYATTLAPQLPYAFATAIHGAPDLRYDLQPLQGFVGRGDGILSEDPTIPILLGQRPVVLDAFMFLRLGERHPEWVADLVRRIDAREFDEVVLLARIGDEPEGWYADTHFGEAVVAAIDRSYRLEAAEFGYYVYVLKTRPS